MENAVFRSPISPQKTKYKIRRTNTSSPNSNHCSVYSHIQIKNRDTSKHNNDATHKFPLCPKLQYDSNRTSAKNRIRTLRLQCFK